MQQVHKANYFELGKLFWQYDTSGILFVKSFLYCFFYDFRNAQLVFIVSFLANGCRSCILFLFSMSKASLVTTLIHNNEM